MILPILFYLTSPATICVWIEIKVPTSSWNRTLYGKRGIRISLLLGPRTRQSQITTLRVPNDWYDNTPIAIHKGRNSWPLSMRTQMLYSIKRQSLWGTDPLKRDYIPYSLLAIWFSIFHLLGSIAVLITSVPLWTHLYYSAMFEFVRALLSIPRSRFTKAEAQAADIWDHLCKKGAERWHTATHDTDIYFKDAVKLVLVRWSTTRGVSGGIIPPYKVLSIGFVLLDDVHVADNRHDTGAEWPY